VANSYAPVAMASGSGMGGLMAALNSAAGQTAAEHQINSEKYL